MMPRTPILHKVPIHGPVIIQNLLFRIGQLSEEASEVVIKGNKHSPDYILNYVRKFSRRACNVYINNRLLLTSIFFLIEYKNK